MWIVAVAWIYVVGLMAMTETSVVAGIMTFFFYCVLPLSILFYLTGGKRRAARRAAAARLDDAASDPGFADSYQDQHAGRHEDSQGGAAGSDDGSDSKD